MPAHACTSSFYDPVEGTLHYVVTSADPAVRARLAVEVAGEVQRAGDWQWIYTSIAALEGAARRYDPDPAVVVGQAQQVADARAAAVDAHPGMYRGPAIVVILELPDGPAPELRDAIKRLAIAGHDQAVAIVLIAGVPRPGGGEPYPWGFPVLTAST